LDRFVVARVLFEPLGVEIDMRIDLLELTVTSGQQRAEEIAQGVLGIFKQLR
jgi:hypothetical protein